MRARLIPVAPGNQTCYETGSQIVEKHPNLKFSSTSVMFIVTFEYEIRVSGNARTRFVRLLDELNRVVGFIFSCRHVFYPLHRASEILRNPPKCREILPILDQNCTDIYRQKSKGILGQTETTNKHDTVQNLTTYSADRTMYSPYQCWS